MDYGTGKIGTGESGSILKKLMKDRRVDRGAKFSPVFGRYSFLDRIAAGERICVGDEVQVVKRDKERTVVGEFVLLASKVVYSANDSARLARPYQLEPSISLKVSNKKSSTATLDIICRLSKQRPLMAKPRWSRYGHV